MLHLARTALLVLITVLACPGGLHAQVSQIADTTGTIRVVYEELDEIQKSTTVFLGQTSGQVTFRLVRIKSLDTDAVVEGVEVTVSEGGEVQYSSMMTGMLGATVGTSTDFVNAFGVRVAEAGFIFLTKSDVEKIVKFLSRVPGQVQMNRRKVWKIWLNKNFELGIEYAPGEVTQNRILTGYSLLITVADTTYEMPWTKARKINSRMQQWITRISGNNK